MGIVTPLYNISKRSLKFKLHNENLTVGALTTQWAQLLSTQLTVAYSAAH